MTIRALTVQELLDQSESEETFATLEAARSAIRQCSSLQAFERDKLIAAIARMPGGPLAHQVNGKWRVNSIEFTRRMMRALDSSAEAVKATSEKPRRHADRGGWKPLKQPAPGRHSGAQRERDAGW